ncbi:MerR family DNA-binding protein [Streptomyces sp. NPDC049954]|uniref:MerR family DNA-binding protein n=1 Tax=Streptomyces sp. NPDC049954 TaxID=3155779 RepID=UPI003435187E
MRYLAIGELARRVGLRASALRYYESLGLLPGARREGGRRMWPATAERRVALIRMARRAGFTLAEIRGLLDPDTTTGASRQWRALATRKLPELDTAIEELRLLRAAVADCLECGCMNFASCGLLSGASDGDHQGPGRG